MGKHPHERGSHHCPNVASLGVIEAEDSNLETIAQQIWHINNDIEDINNNNS